MTRRMNRFRHAHPRLEVLEDRVVPSVYPNDPGFATQWPLHNTGQTGGLYDADIDMPAAWSITTGSMATVVAILDSGVDYTHPDLYLNIWINESEIPTSIAASLIDTDSDGIFTFRDLNALANSAHVTDVNANGYIDGGDLLNDIRWENGVDEDGNGLVDDLVGWDYHDDDNDPFDVNGHGTEVSQRVASIGNNNVGMAGVMWAARLMPVRIELINEVRVIENCAAGLDYAVAMGATISNNSWGDFIYSQVMFDAIERARQAGHLFVASAGNDNADLDVTPRYPASYDLDNIISVMALDATDQKTSTGSFGQVNVDLGAPTDTGANSKATPNVTGVAGLLRTLHPDWTYTQIKAQILGTVDPLASLTGKCVTGGRLNAARALGQSVFPNDPDFAQQWPLHNTGQTVGLYDADIDMPAAWSITTGSMATVIAILDSGVDYTHPDLYLNIWLNEGEIPTAIAGSLSDTDGDSLITFRDLNAAANAAFVTDVNGTGYIDGGDLLSDVLWENGLDEDGNGKIDDLIGWDTHDNDNDPQAIGENHGTEMSLIMGAIANNGVGSAGVNWAVRIMPVCVQFDPDTRINANAAAGLDYAVAEGASISYNRRDNPHDTFSQVMFDAIDRARLAGHLFLGGAGNLAEDMDANPFYPGAYELDNILVMTGVNASDELTALSSWGLNNVDLAAPTPRDAGSPALAYTTGVAALLKSLHPEWNYAQIKAQILATVDPVPSLAGKCVTGGRLNVAKAFAMTSVFISDPTITEGNSGTSQLVFTVTRAGDQNGTFTLDWSTANGTAFAGTDYAAASGEVTFLPGVTTQTIAVNVIGDVAAEATETFFVQLTLASGDALLADEDAQATILDTDTKFYVVDDATTNLTFEYGATGSAFENYTLTAANTAPRGAASNAAGDKVWVVDANKKVYVYNPSGGLLGSWTAGSLTGNAIVEGVATNGTDIWIVDAKQDKVFRYTGAASRLSGSQNAASSFSLNSGNKDPKDIVTDGTSLWVVNNSTTDKVFKYTLAGSLLGSWTIDAANSSPTGITLDPTNVAHLWIVDNGTDRVYQYDNAAGRTSGSQSASTSFALAAGNSNPQGIADPPAVGVASQPVAKKHRSSRLDLVDALFGQGSFEELLKPRRRIKLS
jgi:subtilisin family serine protease